MTWCHVPGTDYPSAQAAEAWIWASCWPNPASTHAPSSSGKNTLDQPSSQPSGQDTSPRPQSGTISQPLKPSHLQAPSTPCWLAILVSRSAKPESGLVPTIPATSGPTSPASSVSLATACAGSSSKMSRATSLSAQKPCCESYGKWAGRLRLAHSRRLKLARRMKGSDGSAWPTATVKTGAQTSENPTPGQTGGTSLPGAAQAWPSPQARDHRSGDSPDSPRQARKAETGWSQNLNDVAEMGTWPTPASRDHKGENSPDHLINGTGRLHLDQLPNAVAFLYSRPAPETEAHGLKLSQFRRIWRPLRASMIASHGRVAWRRLWRSRNKRRLNPLFVEWLMGWPSGHALCACSATGFAHWQRQMRGALSALPMASGPWIWKPSVEGKPQIQEEIDI